MFFNEVETQKSEVANENAELEVQVEADQLEENAEISSDQEENQELEVNLEDVQLEEEMVQAINLQESQLMAELEGCTLNEATVKRRKETIKKQRTTMAALGLARAAGDPMYTKMMQKHREVKEMRVALLRKYEAKAKAVVKH